MSRSTSLPRRGFWGLVALVLTQTMPGCASPPPPVCATAACAQDTLRAIRALGSTGPVGPGANAAAAGWLSSLDAACESGSAEYDDTLAACRAHLAFWSEQSGPDGPPPSAFSSWNGAPLASDELRSDPARIRAELRRALTRLGHKLFERASSLNDRTPSLDLPGDPSIEDELAALADEGRHTPDGPRIAAILVAHQDGEATRRLRVRLRTALAETDAERRTLRLCELAAEPDTRAVAAETRAALRRTFDGLPVTAKLRIAVNAPEVCVAAASGVDTRDAATRTLSASVLRGGWSLAQRSFVEAMRALHPGGVANLCAPVMGMVMALSEAARLAEHPWVTANLSTCPEYAAYSAQLAPALREQEAQLAERRRLEEERAAAEERLAERERLAAEREEERAAAAEEREAIRSECISARNERTTMRRILARTYGAVVTNTAMCRGMCESEYVDRSSCLARCREGEREDAEFRRSCGRVGVSVPVR